MSMLLNFNMKESVTKFDLYFDHSEEFNNVGKGYIFGLQRITRPVETSFRAGGAKRVHCGWL